MINNKRLLSLFFVFLYGFSIKVYAQYAWTQKANFPGSSRTYACAFSIGHYGFVGGGQNSGGTSFYDDFWQWNQHTNTWTQITSYPGAGSSGLVTFTINGVGYVGFGAGNSGVVNDLWAYDTISGWTQKASFPGTPRYACFTFVIGTNAYVGCGDPGSSPYLQDMWEYNSATNTWAQKANFPLMDAGMVGFAIGKNGYAGSGGNMTNFYEYDTAADTWTPIASLPAGINHNVAFVIGNLGFVGTGGNSNGIFTRQFWSYDTTTGTWNSIANLGGVSRTSATSFSIDNFGYVVTGQDSLNTTLNDLWQWGSLNDTTTVCDYWTQKASLTAFGGREGAVGFSIGHYGFIGTGATTSGGVNDFWRWNQDSNTWTAITNYPGAGKGFMTAFVIEGKGYCGLGINGSTLTTDLWEYDTSTNAWTQKASFPGLGRYATFVFVIGTKAYIGCGDPDGAPYYQDVWVYDAVANTWTQVANFPGGNRAGLCAFSLNGYGYAGCGGNDINDFNDLWQYNPNTNTWSNMAPLPVPGNQLGEPISFVIDSLAYVGTGQIEVGTLQSIRDFWSYSPTTNTWTSIAALPGVSRWFGVGFSIGNKGYAGMGQDSAGGYLTDYWEYSPCSNANLSVLISLIENVSCNGGSNGIAAAIANGGASPYTYLWNPSGQTASTASGLSVGIYTLTTTDNSGLTATTSVTVTQPTLLSAQVTGSNIACFDVENGYAIAIPSGGINPYTYLWSNGETTSSISGLSAGIYSVTITDNNNCTLTAIDTITQPNEINATTMVHNISCYGENNGNVTTSVTGGIPPYTYNWSPGSGTNASESGLSAGVYTLSVTDSLGCYESFFVTIVQPLPINIRADSTAIGNDTCSGSAWATVGGGTIPYTYLWTGGVTTDTIKNQCAGYYCCTITDANGCIDSVCVSIVLSTGVENIGNSIFLTLYPNPSPGMLHITYNLPNNADAELRVMDIFGRYINSFKISGRDNEMTLNETSLSNGMYFYQVISSEKLMSSGKFVIAK